MSSTTPGDFTPASKVSIGILGGILAAAVSGIAAIGLVLWRGGAYFQALESRFERLDAQFEQLDGRLTTISGNVRALSEAPQIYMTREDQLVFVRRLLRELKRVHPDLDLDESNL